MKSRPILMCAAMVRATLAGQKTQTRRIMKPQPPEGCTVGWSAFSGENRIECRSYAIPHQSFIKVPYGAKGDHLWVKETWAFEEREIFYRADSTSISGDWKGLDPDLLKAFEKQTPGTIAKY